MPRGATTNSNVVLLNKSSKRKESDCSLITNSYSTENNNEDDCCCCYSSSSPYSGKIGRIFIKNLIHSFSIEFVDQTCLRIPLVFVFVSVFSVLFNLFIIGLLMWTHTMNLHHYTYWNYLLITAFDMLYLCSCFTSPKCVFKYLNVFIFPIVSGSAAVVNILIIVILQNNDWMMVSATVFGGGELPMGKVHLADYIIHSVPLLIRFTLLILGQLDIVRQYISAYLHYGSDFAQPIRGKQFTRKRLWYFIYYMIAPLITIGIYSVFNNPFIEYPTNFTIVEGVLILLLIVFSVQLVSYFSVYVSISTCTSCNNPVQHFSMHLECLYGRKFVNLLAQASQSEFSDSDHKNGIHKQQTDKMAAIMRIISPPSNNTWVNGSVV